MHLHSTSTDQIGVELVVHDNLQQGFDCTSNKCAHNNKIGKQAPPQLPLVPNVSSMTCSQRCHAHAQEMFHAVTQINLLGKMY